MAALLGLLMMVLVGVLNVVVGEKVAGDVVVGTSEQSVITSGGLVVAEVKLSVSRESISSLCAHCNLSLCSNLCPTERRGVYTLCVSQQQTLTVIIGAFEVNGHLILHNCHIQAGDNAYINQAVESAGETES